MVIFITKTINLGLTDELAQKMEQFPEVNWSAVTRECIERYIKERTSEGLEAAISIVREMKSKDFADGTEDILKSISKLDLGQLQEFSKGYFQNKRRDERISYGDVEGPEDLEGFPSADYDKLKEILYSIRPMLSRLWFLDINNTYVPGDEGSMYSRRLISDEYVEGAMEAVAKVLEKSR